MSINFLIAGLIQPTSSFLSVVEAIRDEHARKIRLFCPENATTTAEKFISQQHNSDDELIFQVITDFTKLAENNDCPTLILYSVAGLSEDELNEVSRYCSSPTKSLLIVREDANGHFGIERIGL